MFEVDIDGKKVKAEVSFYTAQLYEAEFGRDIIQDFFGVQDLSMPDDDEATLKIDFTKINWMATARVLWAAVKTADENVESYNSWMKRSSGVNMFVLRQQLAVEVADCFFRAEASEEDAPQEGETK